MSKEAKYIKKCLDNGILPPLPLDGWIDVPFPTFREPEHSYLETEESKKEARENWNLAKDFKVYPNEGNSEKYLKK